MNPRLFTLCAVVLAAATTSPCKAAPATGPSPQTVKLSANADIEFAIADQRLSLAGLRDRRGLEWAGPLGEDAVLWRLSVRGPGDVTAEWTSSDLPLADAFNDDRRVRFTWKAPTGDQTAEVRLRVELEKDSSLSQWRLEASLPAGWVVTRAQWPVLPNLRREANLKLAAPFGWGLEYDVKAGTAYQGTYPSLVASMPFVALYHGGSGLYVGAHDKHGHHKHLAVAAREEGVGVTFTHWPCDADSAGGRYAPGFHVVVGTFAGDYWDAARIYRDFSRGTPWGAVSAASSPAARPQWLRDTELWLMPEAEPLENVEACRRAKEFFGVPIGLHWYRWHEIPFDTLYPDYFPARPNFREGVKALQDAGFRVMPYINGRLCDPKSKAWTEEAGEQAAARQANGEPYTEVYGSKVPLNVMCPATPYWQGKVVGLVDRLVNEEGVDGVYIDQIGAAHAVRCFDARHGHSPGGGTFWFDGYRKMLNQARASLPADRIITTEENAECWNDQFDALLMVNTPGVGGRRMIPLMPSVYSGRVIVFGFQYMAADDISRSLPFRAKMARAFLWGSQLGWIRVEQIMAETARVEAEFLRNLARARQAGHDLLLDGEFLGEADVTGDNPRLQGEGSASEKYPIDLPAVMATAWLAKDGGGSLAVVNLSDHPREVEVRSDRLGGPGVKLTLPARDAGIVRVSEATPKP